MRFESSNAVVTPGAGAVSPVFNPYHEWLGLEVGLTRPDFYQLLELAEFETDPQTIRAAAARALARVRSRRPGDRAAAWANLLDEIEAAKHCLTDPEERAKYGRQRRASGAQDETAPAVFVPTGLTGPLVLAGTEPTNPLTNASSLAADDPMAPYVPLAEFSVGPPAPGEFAARPTVATPPAVPLPPSAAFEGEEPGRETIESAPPLPAATDLRDRTTGKKTVRRRRDRAPLLVSLAAGFMLAGIAGWYAFFLRPSAEEKAADEVLGDVSVLPPQPATKRRTIRRPNRRTSCRPPLRPSPPHSRIRPGRHTGPVESESPPDTEPIARPTETLPAKTPVQTPELAAKGTQTQPAEPSPAMPPPGPPPSAAEAARFEAAIRSLRQALGERDYGLADAALARAAALARGDAEKSRVERLQTLARYAQDFHLALREATRTLKGGTELRVGNSTVVSVVEAGPRQLVIHMNGANLRYGLDELPLGLAAAIAETATLDASDPANLARKAAFVAASPKADARAKEKVRSWLSEALPQLPEAKLIAAALAEFESPPSD